MKFNNHVKLYKCSSIRSFQIKMAKEQVCELPVKHDAVTHRSAPAQDNILLIRITWNGCKRTRRWKASLPQDFTRYLLAQMRPASNASEDICSNSSDTKWIHNGSSSTFAFFRPRSKIRIFGSNISTPLKVVNHNNNMPLKFWTVNNHAVRLPLVLSIPGH